MKPICFCCEKQLTTTYRMVAFDHPYINLFFHVECYLALDCSVDELVTKENEKFIKFLSNFTSKTKK